MQETEHASCQRRERQRLYWIEGWIAEMEEAGDMRSGKRGSLLLHLQTDRERFSALGGDRGHKLHHERLQI